MTKPDYSEIQSLKASHSVSESFCAPTLNTLSSDDQESKKKEAIMLNTVRKKGIDTA